MDIRKTKDGYQIQFEESKQSFTFFLNEEEKNELVSVIEKGIQEAPPILAVVKFPQNEQEYLFATTMWDLNPGEEVVVYSVSTENLGVFVRYEEGSTEERKPILRRYKGERLSGKDLNYFIIPPLENRKEKILWTGKKDGSVMRSNKKYALTLSNPFGDCVAVSLMYRNKVGESALHYQDDMLKGDVTSKQKEIYDFVHFHMFDLQSQGFIKGFKKGMYL